MEYWSVGRRHHSISPALHYSISGHSITRFVIVPSITPAGPRRWQLPIDPRRRAPRKRGSLRLQIAARGPATDGNRRSSPPALPAGHASGYGLLTTGPGNRATR